jgi:hypothetical protein
VSRETIRDHKFVPMTRECQLVYPTAESEECAFTTNCYASYCGGHRNHEWHEARHSCYDCSDRGIITYHPIDASYPMTSCDNCELGAEMKAFL